MSQHAHDYVSAFDCDPTEQGPVNPKHRAHRHPYIAGYDNMSMSRAKCPSGVDAFSCRTAYCPKHEPVTYSAHMARYATDSFGLWRLRVDRTDEPEF